MRVLALTDGTCSARDLLAPLQGIVPTDLHVMPNAIPPQLKRVNVVIVAFGRFPKFPGKTLFDWLGSQDIAHIPTIVCLPASNAENPKPSLWQTPAITLAAPFRPDKLLDAVEQCYRPFSKLRKHKLSQVNQTTQAVANVFSSLFGGEAHVSEDAIAQVAMAADGVNQTVTSEGLQDWLFSVAQYHSYTARHCMIVAGFASKWASVLGFNDEDQHAFTKAALLHDIGKLEVPLEILDKPGPLTPVERERVNRHPEAGYRMLIGTDGVTDLMREITYAHHEFLDGSGYPRGLVGKEIVDAVRCMTIIDIYSALIDARAYKDPMMPDKAFAVLCDMEKQLDATLLDAFRPMYELHVSALKTAA
ncbi:MAG: HD domain-containing phosphohydrolase [Pseudomonadota bacterium]